MRRKIWGGQAIVEVVMALALALVALVGMVQVATRSVSSSGLARRQAQATGLTGQVLELVRSQKDSLGWDGFKAVYNGAKCFDGVNIVAGSSCVISGTEFTSGLNFSYLNVTPVPAGSEVEQMTVVVEISWNEGSRTAKATQTQVFTRY